MTAGLVIGGIWSMTQIPLDAVPDITNNQVQVITTAQNLGTEDIEQFVSYPVELAMSNLPGVTEIRSISRFGLSVVTIVFEDKMGTYLPRQLVNEALTHVKEDIPQGFGEPFMAPISTGLGEIYQYILKVEPGYEYSDMELRTIQDWIVKRQMAMLPGVVEVNTFGGHVKQYEVAMNPDKLQSMGLTISQVFEALEGNNQNTGGAYIEKDHRANFIRGEGLARSLQDIENTVVANKQGQPIFIRDIAEVKYGSGVRYGAFTKDGRGESVGGIVMMLKGENSNDVIKLVKERMELIQKSLPEGVFIQPFLDRSKLIKSTTGTVAENLSMGALIVIFVLVLILGNLRGGFIVASTIPLALLFAFIMMHILGISANLMSLGAIDFGILVDGAVIIVENMLFHFHKKSCIGKKLSLSERNTVAFDSASSMMNSAFFGQLIILIVFIPILTLQGVEGKMFIPMAITFGSAVLGVVILCLTYIPMMSALFIQPPASDKKTWGDKLVSGLEKVYRPALDWALHKSRMVIGISVLLLCCAGFIFMRSGAEFIPQLDEGDIAMHIFLKPGTSLTDVIDASTRAENILLEQFPDEILSVQTRIGVSDVPTDPMPIDIGDMFILLKPEDEWTKASNKPELVTKMREAVSILPGINYEFTQPIEMRFNELLTGIREDIAIKLFGDDLKILADKAEEIAGLVAGLKGVAGVKAEAIQGLPQITVNYDRNKLGQYGLRIEDLNTMIESAFSGRTAGVIYEGEKRFDLVVRLDDEHRKSIEDIRNLFVSLSDGTQIPIKEVADIDYQPGPMQISRENTNRRTYVGINVEGRDIKSLVEEIQQTLDERLSLPAGYYIRYGGAFENLQRAAKRLWLVVPLALTLIFILVFFAVKSLRQTLIIYVAIPLAAVGGVFSLFLRGMPFSISAGVGFIVLFGVAILNGLVLINSFNELKKEGNMDLLDLIRHGSIRRIRPIILTATVDILGFFPMAVSASAGAEVQRPLATVVIGGLITSTLLTLLVLPVLYKWAESRKRTLKKPSLKTAGVLIMIIMGSAGILNNTSAQEPTVNLNQAIERAKQVYPSMQAAQFEIDKQRAMKGTVFDLGTTSVYTGREEFNNESPGVEIPVGVSQTDIDLLGIPARSGLARSRNNVALQGKNLTRSELVRDVSTAFYNAATSKQHWKLYSRLDTLYADFLKAAELRYETQQTSRLEYLLASSKYQELQVTLKKAQSEYESALEILNQYLAIPGNFSIDEGDFNQMDFEIQFPDSLSTSPQLEYFSAATEVAKSEWRVLQSGYLPKIDLSYEKQILDGNTGFHAYEAGISIPLLFFSQHGQSRAAKMDYFIAKKDYERMRLQTQAEYRAKVKNLLALQEILRYYRDEALPLANEQIQASGIAYRLGSIDYMQFIQNAETAIQTQRDFIDRLSDYFELATELKYITGE